MKFRNEFHLKGNYNVDNSKLKDDLKGFGYLKGAVAICLTGPLLEESIFRLPLSLKRNHIAIALALAILFFSGKLYTVTSVDRQLVLRIAVATAAFCLTIKFAPDNLYLIDNKTKTIANITSICLFGLLHIPSYSLFNGPLFLFTQFIRCRSYV